MEALFLLASAVLGAIAGGAATYYGTRVLESQRLQRLRIGTLRATLGELQANGASALSFLTIGPDALATFSSETWRVANLEMAQFIPHAVYQKLTLLYRLLPATQVHAQTPSTSPHAAEHLKNFVDLNKEVMDTLLMLPEARSFRDDWQDMPPGPLFARQEINLSGQTDTTSSDG